MTTIIETTRSSTVRTAHREQVFVAFDQALDIRPELGGLIDEGSRPGN